MGDVTENAPAVKMSRPAKPGGHGHWSQAGVDLDAEHRAVAEALALRVDEHVPADLVVAGVRLAAPVGVDERDPGTERGRPDRARGAAAGSRRDGGGRWISASAAAGAGVRWSFIPAFSWLTGLGLTGVRCPSSG